MYYRDNGKIIEGFQVIENLDGSEDCCKKTPMWAIILLIVLILLALAIPVYSLFIKSKSKK